MSARAKHARRRPTTRRRALTVIGGLAATALPLLGAGTAQAATAADWQKLAMCESGGNWAINTGNGYYGGLQFSYSTWLGYGGGAYAARADLATPAQQMAIADKTLAAQGWNAWPSCSRKTGLYGTPTTASPAPPPPPPMVYGDILARYNALGGASGFLGAPVTAEAGSVRGGRWNFFQRGAIYWTPGQGAYEVHGDIRAKWQSLRSEFSVLGYPVSNEQRTPTRAGAYNVFESGAVYWSPATGAHEVHGLVHKAWAATGWENGPAGFPMSDEIPLSTRFGAIQGFEGGAVVWSPSTGAHLVRGAINAAWNAVGADHSRLGLPTSGEVDIPGGRKTTFEHGSITWTPTRGAKVTLR
ncbi:MAG TPA: transglycosylase family protein [Mycobacteriales bacterium]|jgi:hypothetical protein|nr:transglycosylase family protein [Mycobacteriales bacterium]